MPHTQPAHTLWSGWSPDHRGTSAAGRRCSRGTAAQTCRTFRLRERGTERERRSCARRTTVHGGRGAGVLTSSQRLREKRRLVDVYEALGLAAVVGIVSTVDKVKDKVRHNKYATFDVTSVCRLS